MKKFGQTTFIIFYFCLFAMVKNTSLLFSQEESDMAKDNVPQLFYGNASWYGEEFEGRTTASGAIYSSKNLVAAHKSLPFGTRLLVENLSNNKVVEVLVIDRGPFVQNRILDLSKQAASVLDFLSYGTAFVKVTILELGSTASAPLKPFESSVEGEMSSSDASRGVVLEDVEVVDLDNQHRLSKRSSLKESSLNFSNTKVVSQDISTIMEEDEDEDEFSYMDDSLSLPTISDISNSYENVPQEQTKYEEHSIQDSKMTTISPINPTGFKKNSSEIILDDPLYDVDISTDDEFVIAPMTPDDGIPGALTSEERILLEKEAKYSDPFSELFHETRQVDSFQSEIQSSLKNPVKLKKSAANNLDSTCLDSQKIILPPVDMEKCSTCPLSSPEPKPMIPCCCCQHTPCTPPTIPPPPCSHSVACSPPREIIVECRSSCCHYVVQVGAFCKLSNALRLYDQLKHKCYNVFISEVCIHGKTLTRVRVGYCKTMEEAMELSQKLKCQGLPNKIIKIDL